MKKLFSAICALSMIVLSSRAATSGDVVTYLGTSTNVTLDINKSPFYWVPSTNCRFSLFGTLSRTNAIKQLQLTINASSDLLITNVVDSLSARTTFGQLYTGLNTVFLQWNGAQWEVWQEPASRNTSIDTGISTTQVTTNTLLQSQIDTLQSSTVMTIIGTGALNPADATTYYLGRLAGVSAGLGTTFTNAAVAIPRSGTITRADLRVFVGGVLGTSEAVGHLVDYDAGAATLDIGNGSYAVANVLPLSATGSVAVTAGHYLALRIVCPTWVTNPTAISYHLQILIE